MLGRWSYARCERCPLSWDRSRPTGVDTSSRRCTFHPASSISPRNEFPLPVVVGGAQQLWYIAAPVLLGNFAPKIHHLHWLIHNHYAIRIEVSVARRWSAHLVAVDVRAVSHSGSSSPLSSRTAAAGVAGQRLSDTVVCQGRTTRTVRSGRVALQG
ncbi:hypothetical protein BD309DRAFT_1061529 [Dichomitus squalens]|nr:hypothetical protein BD309DRAFT_1061529 [Dichomitus squalens]